jgi:hypothetical protein
MERLCPNSNQNSLEKPRKFKEKPCPSGNEAESVHCSETFAEKRRTHLRFNLFKQHRKLTVNYELGRIPKEAAVTCFDIISQYFLQGT